MVEWRDVGIVVATGVVLAATVAMGYGIIHVLLASFMVAISLINAAPSITRATKRHLILGLTGVLILTLLPIYQSYAGYLFFLLGGLIGVAVMVLKGPEYREVALTILGGSALVGAGFAYRANRTGPLYVFLIFGVLSIITAWYLRES